MEYFSDSEIGKIPQTVTEVPHSFWCALVSKITQRFTQEREERFKKIYDTCELDHFLDQLKGEVPSAPNPLTTKDQWGQNYTPDRAVVMDIIQFFYQWLNSVDRESLCQEINRLFERNTLAFKLLENGNIERLINPVLSDSIKRTPFNTGDKELDQYLNKAVSKFLHHDIKTRKESLEALWDAFERIKTIAPGNKSVSAKILVEKSSICQNMRERIDNEAAALRKIGNEFMIRHSETNKIQITEEKHMDYLFHRMFALIWLWLESLE